jgi:hypothetical protein
VGITADPHDLQRPVGSIGRWTIHLSRPGGRTNKGHRSFAGFGESAWGTGSLCNSNSCFLWDTARAEIEGLAIRCGALPQAACEIDVKLGRHLKAAGCGLPDDGARP